MHAMAGSGDITRMGGLARKLPWTTWVFRVCWLAICGVPIFSGFFSKDAIVAGAFATEVFGPRLHWVGPTVGAGLLAAWLLGRVVSGLLFAVSPHDGWTMAAVSGVLAAVSAAVCYLPARRVTRADPLRALRYE